MPYVPKRQMDKDILAAWQKTKMLEWKPDAAQWETFIADDEREGDGVNAEDQRPFLRDYMEQGLNAVRIDRSDDCFMD